MQEQGLGKGNRVQEMDTNMVHRPGMEQDMVHKKVLGTVTDKVPGKVTDKVPGMVRKLDMVLGLKKASELAPAPALSTCIPLTVDRKAVYHLTDSWMNYPCYSFEMYCTQMKH